MAKTNHKKGSRKVGVHRPSSALPRPGGPNAGSRSRPPQARQEIEERIALYQDLADKRLPLDDKEES